jgi:hypothetical protein
LLKVPLNTIKQTNIKTMYIYFLWMYDMIMKNHSIQWIIKNIELDCCQINN